MEITKGILEKLIWEDCDSRQKWMKVWTAIVGDALEKEEGPWELLYGLLFFGINILLVVAIGMLILLSLRSDLPTIVNYRTAIVNEYSEWEQELTERERAVREAERALEK